MSAAFGAKLQQRLAPRAAEILGHPQRRLHVFTSRGRHLLHRPGRLRAAAGYAGRVRRQRRAAGAPWAAGWSAWSSAMRAIALPFPLHDYRSQQTALTPQNLARAVLASCSIPFALEPVQDPPGAPPGTYWDGGLTDYHLHLDYAAWPKAWCSTRTSTAASCRAGWTSRWKHRHRATASLDNVVVLAPRPDWLRTLPLGKLPDRSDFKTYGDDEAAPPARLAPSPWPRASAWPTSSRKRWLRRAPSRRCRSSDARPGLEFGSIQPARARKASWL